MKKVIKILNYLSIVLFWIIFVIFSLISFNEFIYINQNRSSIPNAYYLSFMTILTPLLMLVWAILATIFGVKTIKKLEKAKSKDELLPITICCLIFCNIISGILLLVLDEVELGIKEKDESGALKKDEMYSLENELSKINTMKENNLISEEEYKELRKKTIDKYL